VSTDSPDTQRPESESKPLPRTGGTQSASDGRAQSHRPKVLAFYLPQFHPIPENDEWWEPGFTEWNNVVKAKPLFPGHYQPHLPGELGFYDLRVPEVREQQAALAGQYGIHGFVYYHYWFHGRRLLERPFEEVLSSGRPDFPFALCWANEEWTRNWDALSGNVLVEQRFSEADDLAHIRWLVRAFADERYIKIDGRPLMLVYRSDLLPNPNRTTDLWREETRAAGFPDIYLAMVESRQKDDDPRPIGFDASVGFASNIAERLDAPVDAYRENLVLDYDAAPEAALRRPKTPWKRFPGVMVGWDNSPRRRSKATIYSGGTPEAYGRWLRRTIDSVADVRDEENLIFITAWNEWAEGNHLEPDRRYGRAYLDATRQALEGVEAPPAVPDVDLAEPVDFDPDSAAGHVFRTVSEVITEPRRAVEIGPGTAGLASAFEDAGIGYQQVAADTGDDEPAALLQRLDSLGDLGALVLGDVLEQCQDPHRLLAALSNWACDHGNPPLVVSVANVAHFDVGVLLLCGRWDPPGEHRLGGTVVHNFTRAMLDRLLQRCGWKVATTDDHESIFSPRHSTTLVEQLPEAMAGALAVLAQSTNPDWAVEHFVWSLEPVGVEEPPSSYADAVAGPSETTVADLPADVSRIVSDYFTSIGLLAGKDQWRVEDRLRRSGLQIVRKQIQEALVELYLGYQWADRLPLLSDTVDELADMYLARSDLVSTFDDDGTFDAHRYVRWAIDDQPMVAAAVARLGEQPRRAVRKQILEALVELFVGDQSTGREPLLSDTVDQLADMYLARSDLVSTFDDHGTFDAHRYIRWAIEDQPMVAAAVAQLGEQPRREAARAIRAELSLSAVDREDIEVATDALVDFYMRRPDLQDALGNGTTVDAIGFLSWVLSDDEASVGRLSPYRALIESATSRHYEQPRREAAQVIRAALALSQVDREHIEAATDALVDLYIHRPDLQDSLGNGTTVDATRFLSWAASQVDPSADGLGPYRALIESALSSGSASPSRTVRTVAVSAVARWRQLVRTSTGRR
jgi:Glycosyltransferase WbsX